MGDVYLNVDGIPGDSTADGHADEMELLGWSVGASVPVGPRTAGGSGAAGTSVHQELTCTKQVDSASNDIFSACWEGKTIPEAVLMVQRQGEGGGGKVDYIKITLTDIIVSNYNRSGGETDIPTESFALNYSSINSEYFTTDVAGGSGGWQAKGWSVAEEKPL